MLQWARDNGCPCPNLDIIILNAARSGNVEMMTWFLEQGCPLDGMLCTGAAEYGRLEVLMWLREHGCPADLDECTDRATRGGHNEVVAWLVEFSVDTWHTTVNWSEKVTYSRNNVAIDLHQLGIIPP